MVLQDVNIQSLCTSQHLVILLISLSAYGNYLIVISWNYIYLIFIRYLKRSSFPYFLFDQVCHIASVSSTKNDI